MNNNDKKVAAYLQAERELMRRYEELKYGRFMSDVQSSRMFGPLLTPLQEINEKVADKKDESLGRDSKFVPVQIQQSETTPKETAPKETAGAKSRKSYRKFDSYDPYFGIYLKDGELYVGNRSVKLSGDFLVLDNGNKYHWTPGLHQLMTENNPRHYTEADLANYCQIIKETFAYKLDNDPYSFRCKYNSSEKYKTIIAPLIDKYKLLDGRKATRSGKGLTKELTTNTVEYVYWNNLDELLERLYILYGEVKAGNTNPSIRNEITNILKEIKEEKHESRLHF